VTLTESGHYVCPWCEQHEGLHEWWTVLGRNPYQADQQGWWQPTLFHQACTAEPRNEKVGEWLSVLRERYDSSRFKPGHFVRLVAVPRDLLEEIEEEAEDPELAEDLAFLASLIGKACRVIDVGGGFDAGRYTLDVSAYQDPSPDLEPEIEIEEEYLELAPGDEGVW
jgi:hypothetical protein